MMVTRITKLRRERNSANGNPRYRVFTLQGAYLTGTDSMVAFMLGDEWIGRIVTLTLDHNDCITNIERA